MNTHLFLSGVCLLLLVSLVAVPVLAADCPSTCSCLLPAKAEELGYSEYCSRTQAVCGYDAAKNAKYCYTIPVTCPSSCSCYTLEDGKMLGYPRCGGTLTFCGTGENQHPMYCHQLPVTEEPATCPSSCTCQKTKPYLEAGYRYCNGTQKVCGEDEVGNPLSCFEIPVTPAPVQVPRECSASCSCYTLEEGTQRGYTLCGGTQTLCGYKNQIPMFCHEPPVTVTTTTPVPVVQGKTESCPSTCFCYTTEEGTQRGYTLCGATQSLCGYKNQIPLFCHQPPETVTPPVVVQATPSPCFETYVGSGSLKTSRDGSLNCSVQITASDRQGALQLPQGTQVLDPTNHPVPRLSIARAVSTGLPPVLNDEQYRYEGYAYRCLPEGAHFDPPTVITISPGEDEWNAAEGKDLVIREYIAGESRWEDRPTTIYAEERTITATLDHFSTLALFSRTNTTSAGETAATGSVSDPWKGTPLFPAIPAEYAPLAALVVGMIAIFGGSLVPGSGPRTQKITGMTQASLKTEAAGLMSQVEIEKRKLTPHPSGSEASILSFREIAVIAGSAAIFALAFILRDKIVVEWSTLLIFFLMGGVATIGHELGHRAFGRRYGFPSELQIWPLGSATMLLTAWIFGTAFAKPSRTVVKGVPTASELQQVIVMVAGPLVNLLFAVLSFLLLPLGGYLTVMGTAGFSMNLLAYVCTLMPVKPMDGERVFRWNRLAWGVIWIPIFVVYCLFFIF